MVYLEYDFVEKIVLYALRSGILIFQITPANRILALMSPKIVSKYLKSGVSIVVFREFFRWPMFHCFYFTHKTVSEKSSPVRLEYVY